MIQRHDDHHEPAKKIDGSDPSGGSQVWHIEKLGNSLEMDVNLTFVNQGTKYPPSADRHEENEAHEVFLLQALYLLFLIPSYPSLFLNGCHFLYVALLHNHSTGP